MMKDIVKRYEELIEMIKRYNIEYHIESASTISDYDYDMLYKELRDLESKYPEIIVDTSPTKQVGVKIRSGKKIEHKLKMYSLDNSYSRLDIEDFINRILKNITDHKNLKFVIEPKIDGAAISIRYDNGRLIEASTRGDGIEGEDILSNILALKILPVEIDVKRELLMRGEIYMPITVFKQLNIIREEQELPLFANPRNAASGSLKLLDSSEVVDRGLKLFIYSLDIGQEHDTHFEDLKFLSKLGFPINDNLFLEKTNDDIFTAIDKIEKLKTNIDYEIDGAVLKVDNYSIREELGFTAKYPRFAISYKYKAAQAESRLLAVTYQVGRTGAITPVAELEPINLSGSTIKRATLHNNDEIKRLGLKIGDTVIIEKGGEVIPKIISVNRSIDNSLGVDILSPVKCPVCEHTLKTDPADAKDYCVNSSCSAIVKGTILHFSSRNAMDIKGLGTKVVDQFYEAGFLNDIADIYDIKREKIEGLDGWKDQSIDNILSSIQASKSKSFDKVLYGLGIRHIGIVSAKILAEKFLNIDSIISASIDEIASIYGIGDEIAKSIILTFREQKYLSMIDRLKSHGFNFKFQEESKLSDTLNGKIFLITGTLLKPRKHYEELINQHGGKVISSVNKQLDYLLVGTDPGSKLAKAIGMNIEVIDEEKFIDMI